MNSSVCSACDLRDDRNGQARQTPRQRVEAYAAAPLKKASRVPGSRVHLCPWYTRVPGELGPEGPRPTRDPGIPGNWYTRVPGDRGPLGPRVTRDPGIPGTQMYPGPGYTRLPGIIGPKFGVAEQRNTFMNDTREPPGARTGCSQSEAKVATSAIGLKRDRS
jgi:hypothetical protein